MRQGISRRLAGRGGSATAVTVMLLAMAAVFGDCRLVSTLSGRAWEGVAPRAGDLGYYEGLINEPRFDTGAALPVPPPGWRPFGGEDTGIVRHVPSYLRWEMRPNLDVFWNGSPFHTNSMGFRTPEVKRKKPAGTYRILVFGSSNTMGYGVADHEVYTRLLERWLQTSIRTGGPVEVVNLAVAGDSPTRRLARLQKEAQDYGADWLLCDASALDSWLEDVHIHAVLQGRIAIPYPFVQAAVDQSGVTPADTFESFRVKFAGQSERLLPYVFAAWSAEARRLRVPICVLILPRADSKAKSPRVFRLIRDLARSSGLDYLDLSEVFDRLDVDEFRISEWDKHPSPRGHQLIFEAIRDALRRRRSLPGLSPFTGLYQTAHSYAWLA